MAVERLTVDLQKLERRVERLETLDSPAAVTAGGGAGGAPVDAAYVVLAYNGGLTQERLLQATPLLSFTDGGANNPVTLSTTATQGSVLFAGPAGALAQDNARLFWDDTNDYLGINMNTPAAHVEINAATATDVGLIVQTTDDNTASNLQEWQNAAGNDLALMTADGHLGINEAVPGAMLHVTASGAAVIGVIIEGAAGQSEDLQQWNSNAATLARFNEIGQLGIGADPSAYVDVAHTWTDLVGTFNLVELRPTINPGAASTAVIRGMLMNLETAGANNIGTVESFRGVASHFGTGTVASMFGLEFESRNFSTGTVNFSFAEFIKTTNINAGGLISTARGVQVDVTNVGTIFFLEGIRISTPVNTGTLSFNTALSIQDQNTATNDWAIVTNAGRVVFNEGGDASTDIRAESNNFTHMFFLDAGFDSVLINSSADLSSTFGVVTTAAADIGQVIRGSAAQSAHLLVLQTSAPANFFESSTGLVGSTTTWNQQGLDINFIVEAFGVADALIVDGAAGQITLGALGAGVVQSTAGGVLSSGAVPLVDIAGYAQGSIIIGGAADWEALVHPGAAGYALISDATELVWDLTPNWLGDHTWTSATAAKPILTLENTNADGNSPSIDFYKNTASPLDGDNLSLLQFFGETSTGAKERYAFMVAESLDVTNGNTGGGIRFTVVMGAVERNLFEIAGYNGVVTQGEVIVNQAGQDVDFRVEGVGAANALVVQGSDGFVGIGTNAPGRPFHVLHATSDTLAVFESGDAQVRISLVDNTTTSDLHVGIEALGDDLRLRAGNARQVYVLSGGNVGINMAVPTAQLHVDQSAAAGAKPCLILDQGDASEQCIQFSGDGADQDIFLFTVDVTGTPTLLWDESEDALIISGADLHMNNGAADTLFLRRSGDVAATEADIYAESQMGLAADSNVHIFIDADNSSTTDFFAIQKNAENVAAATEVMRVTEAPILFLNETSNANMTVGITLDQGANDDEILNGRSSDVGAVLNTVETNTFFTLAKAAGASGGASIRGFRDADGTAAAGLAMFGHLAENVDTTKTTAGRAITELYGFQTDATNLANTVADGNVVVVRTQRGGSAVTLFIVDEDGDLFADGGVATTNMVTLFDDYRDAELVRAFDIARGPEQVIRTEFDRYIEYNENTLVEAGILGAPIADGGLINVTRLQQLHNGAIWQNYCEIRELHSALMRANEALIELGADPVALTGG